MIWRFTLIEADDTETVIDEPVGWDALSMVLQRDKDWHGIAPQFSVDNLQFTDDAYFILQAEYLRAGIDGDIGIRIEWGCDDCNCYKLFFAGKIDFSRYQENCGDDCYISAGIEEDSPLTQLKNRGDTDVDLTSNIAFDGVTTLTDYAGLNKTITVPSKALFEKAQASILPITDTTPNTPYSLLGDFDFNAFLGTDSGGNEGAGIIIPKFDNVTLNEIENFLPDSEFDFAGYPPGDSIDDHLDLLTDNAFEIINVQPSSLGNILNNYAIAYRLKGNIHVKFASGPFDSEHPSSAVVQINLKVGAKKDVAGVISDVFAPIDLGSYSGSSFNSSNEEGFINYDTSGSYDIDLGNNDRFWLYFIFSITVGNTPNTFPPIHLLEIQGDGGNDIDDTPFNFINAELTSLEPASPCKTYLLHEAASRVVESITNNSLKFKSEYFGRIDSEPFAFDADGCGGLRTLTNGLQLRRAVLTDGSNPKVFTNWQNVLDSLNALDHIGFGIEVLPATDPDFPNASVVRSEPVSYFYKPDVVFIADGVNAYTKKIRTDRIWNQFNFGFEKYETESTNGLDAIHTKRQYRIPIQNIDTVLEKLCKYILDGYPIEETRRLFGSTADWRYDQDIFMLCLARVTDLIVEQGNIDFAANLFDPPTVLNYRLTPIRNAMRWFNWLVQGIRQIDPDLTQMLFNSGDGNYVAKGKLQGATCFNEANAIEENDPLFVNQFADPDAAKPFIVPEDVSFTYPLGLNEFLFLKENIYGVVQYRRYEDDPWQFGWIDKLEPHHEEGDALFTLVTALGIEPVDIENFILTESGLVLETEDGIGLTEG